MAFAWCGFQAALAFVPIVDWKTKKHGKEKGSNTQMWKLQSKRQASQKGLCSYDVRKYIEKTLLHFFPVLLKFSFRNANHLTILLWFLFKDHIHAFLHTFFFTSTGIVPKSMFSVCVVGVWGTRKLLYWPYLLHHFRVRDGNMALFGSHFQSQYIVNYSRFSLCLTVAGKVW